MLGVSRQYIHQLIKSGALKAFQLSGYVALPKAQVLAWKAQRDAQAAEEEAREAAVTAA